MLTRLAIIVTHAALAGLMMWAARDIKQTWVRIATLDGAQ